MTSKSFCPPVPSHASSTAGSTPAISESWGRAPSTNYLFARDLAECCLNQTANAILIIVLGAGLVILLCAWPVVWALARAMKTIEKEVAP